MLACPHPGSFVCLVPAFQEDVEDGLAPVAALTFIGVGLIDSVEVCVEADLSYAHLRDYRAYRSMCSCICIECMLSWLDTKSEELPTVLSLLPELLLFAS